MELLVACLAMSPIITAIAALTGWRSGARQALEAPPVAPRRTRPGAGAIVLGGLRRPRWERSRRPHAECSRSRWPWPGGGFSPCKVALSGTRVILTNGSLSASRYWAQPWVKMSRDTTLAS
ncbi:MAG: hypothetical protein ACREPA_05910 [Candidatus Dormibacteraceae bacterium]